MQQIDREELYDRVWAEPLSALAPKLGVSYPTLRTACGRAAIPLPDRGYWARLAAGKPVVRARLPLRPPGLHELVQIGGGRYRLQPQLSREEILGDIPEPPSFAEPLVHVEARVRKAVGSVKAVKSLDSAHHVIGRLLKADDERRQKQLRSRWPSSWDAPLFDPPFEQRRLRILNTLFMAVSRAVGAKPSLSGREARTVTFDIRDEYVGLRLDTPRNVHKDPIRENLEPRDAKSAVRLVILKGPWTSSERMSWQDEKDHRVEQHLTEAAVHIILAAELQYREDLVFRHKWRIERRAEMIEEDRRAREKAAREERERLERLARERVARLLAEADALRGAEAIRAYVERVRAIAPGAGHGPDRIERWAEWARRVADEVDPVTSGRFAGGWEDSAATAAADAPPELS